MTGSGRSESPIRLTILGSGTSFGVPVVGCECPTCTSDDPRDSRTRHAAVVELSGVRVLVDTPPELRLQLIASGIAAVDAVWFTHTHADHVHGIDDLRVFTLYPGGDLPAFVPEEYAEEMYDRFRYVFDASIQPPPGTSKPEGSLRAFSGAGSVDVLGHDFHPLALPHGPVNSYGFRVGNLGYITDAKTLTPSALGVLEGVDVLVLNALWFGDPHPAHFNVEEAVEAAKAVGARRTLLTHLTHRVKHSELADWLPDGIEPAYDGLVVEVRA